MHTDDDDIKGGSSPIDTSDENDDGSLEAEDENSSASSAPHKYR